MIQIKNIHKYFRTKEKVLHALQGINLTIEAGKVFGIIGRSGAGKSTLIRMINLLERPDEGEVIIDGTDITKLSDGELRRLRQQIGMVFQHFNLLNSRTVLDNVIYPMRIAGVDKATRKARALELLKLVGLEDHIHKYPRQLSGGQKQRVGIARALTMDPKILLCDEATSALDPETTQSVLALLNEINRTLGITIVLITHSMDVIRNICDQVAVIDGGKIVEQGEVVEVFLHPQHDTTLALLSESGVDADGWKLFVHDIQGDVIRLTYHGQAAAEPLLSQISQELGLSLSIFQGAVGKIKDTPFGQLVIVVNYPEGKSIEETQQKMQTFFKEKNVDVEVLQA
ncbi:ATP-binding cassette domain-containing protein [Pelistega sp. NLN82]|uniref:ATP-binding cassette domain-containing protein n=1 Tax=Pelistega ratti TaxID=2652177 RepID=A0A6L9Y6H9_9BURK|nr:ATP-binding cassette domain-containing protein [Pelistega ratti]NEN75953.1 ATP-binding cassette domain-containing protein [Pelistega ratti]